MSHTPIKKLCNDFEVILLTSYSRTHLILNKCQCWPEMHQNRETQKKEESWHEEVLHRHLL